MFKGSAFSIHALVRALQGTYRHIMPIQTGGHVPHNIFDIFYICVLFSILVYYHFLLHTILYFKSNVFF